MNGEITISVGVGDKVWTVKAVEVKDNGELRFNVTTNDEVDPPAFICHCALGCHLEDRNGTIVHGSSPIVALAGWMDTLIVQQGYTTLARNMMDN